MDNMIYSSSNFYLPLNPNERQLYIAPNRLSRKPAIKRVSRKEENGMVNVDAVDQTRPEMKVFVKSIDGTRENNISGEDANIGRFYDFSYMQFINFVL